MQGENISRALGHAYPPAVRSALVSAISAAVKNATRCYHPEYGANAHWFGMTCYHFACHECEKLVAADLPAEVARIPRPSSLDFKLRVNGFRTAIHRVGATVDDPIEGCFPTSPGGPGQMARENCVQMSLALDDRRVVPSPRNVVVAYMGNPEDGLGAIYLCVPDGTTEEGRVNHWAYSELLWKRDEESGENLPPDFPPPAPDRDPAISIRVGVIEEQQGGASA